MFKCGLERKEGIKELLAYEKEILDVNWKHCVEIHTQKGSSFSNVILLYKPPL